MTIRLRPAEQSIVSRRVSEAPRSPVRVHLYLSPVAPPGPLLRKDSLVVDVGLLPEQDLLQLRPLEGAVRQLPPLVLKARTAEADHNGAPVNASPT